MDDFYLWYTPSEGESKMTMEFLERIHIFVLSWKRNLTKRDCSNLKTTQIVYYSIKYKRSSESWTLFQKFSM